MSRVKTVHNNYKERVCGKCRKTIAKGAGYRWTKPRYGSIKIRCLEPACAFKPSDLSWSKTAIIWDAIEEAQSDIAAAESYEEIQSALRSVAEVAREVEEEYRDASSSWAGGNGHPEFDEKADTCESFADELESWEFSGETDGETIRAAATEDKGEQDDTTDLGDEAWEAALDEMRSEADDVLTSFDL